MDRVNLGSDRPAQSFDERFVNKPPPEAPPVDPTSLAGSVDLFVRNPTTGQVAVLKDLASAKEEFAKQSKDERSLLSKVLVDAKNFVSEHAGKIGTGASLVSFLIPVVGPLLGILGLAGSYAVAKNADGVRRYAVGLNKLSFGRLFKETVAKSEVARKERLANEEADKAAADKADEADKRPWLAKTWSKGRTFVTENAGKIGVGLSAASAFIPVVGPVLAALGLIASRGMSMDDETGERRYKSWPLEAKARLNKLSAGRFFQGASGELASKRTAKLV